MSEQTTIQSTLCLQITVSQETETYQHLQVCSGGSSLQHTRARRTQEDVIFKHGGSTVCGLHQLSRQLAHRRTCCAPFIYLSQKHHFLFFLQGKKRRGCLFHPCNHFPSAPPPSVLSTWSELLIWLLHNHRTMIYVSLITQNRRLRGAGSSTFMNRTHPCRSWHIGKHTPTQVQSAQQNLPTTYYTSTPPSSI